MGEGAEIHNCAWKVLVLKGGTSLEESDNSARRQWANQVWRDTSVETNLVSVSDDLYEHWDLTFVLLVGFVFCVGSEA